MMMMMMILEFCSVANLKLFLRQVLRRCRATGYLLVGNMCQDTLQDALTELNLYCLNGVQDIQ